MSRVEVPPLDDLTIERRPAPHEPRVAEPKEPAEHAPRKGRLPRIARSLMWILAGVTALGLWFLFHALVLGPLQTGGSQARLRAQFREAIGNGTVPAGGRIAPGRPVARLVFGSEGPRNLIVVEGTSPRELSLAPGHLSNTPMPGQPGTAVLLGRSVTYGAPFRAIALLREGVLIEVTTGQGRFTYRVDRVRRPGDRLPPPLLAGSSRLMLVTAVGEGWRRGWAPDHMIYVDASLTRGTVQPAPSGRPKVAPKIALPMARDMGALPALAIWLQALILVSGGLAWARIRWGRAQTWITGVPLVIVVLWGASGAVARLLPNLI